MKSYSPKASTLATHWIWSLPGVLLLAFLYSLVHSVLRMLATDTIAQDDVVGNVLAQVLAVGYIVRQGPLYDMALWFVQQVTGPYLIGFLILKYAFLIATTAFIYLSARRILNSQFWAGLTACSLSLFFQLGWNIHEGVTHTAALMCFIAASFWAFTRIAQDGGWQNYILFGVFLGCGFLSKHTFGVFVFLLFTASLLQKPLRQKIFHPLMLLSLAVALILMTPYLLWLIDRLTELQSTAKLAVGLNNQTYVERILVGLPVVLKGPFGFMIPLILVLPVLFPNFLKTVWQTIRAPYTRVQDKPDLERLVYHMTIAAVLALLIALFAFGIWRFKERYLHPFFLISVIGLMALAMHSAPSIPQIKRFLGVMVLTGVIVLGFRAANFWIGEPFCGPCRQLVPYHGVADALRKKGFETGTLIAGFRFTGGNMRKHFPNTRIINLSNPYFVPPRREAYKDQAQDLAVVWRVRHQSDLDTNIPTYIQNELNRLKVTNIPPVETVKVPWTHLWRPTGYRTSTWKVIYIPNGLPASASDL